MAPATTISDGPITPNSTKPQVVPIITRAKEHVSEGAVLFQPTLSGAFLSLKSQYDTYSSL